MFEKLFKSYRPFLLIVMILLSAIWYYSFTNLSKESIPDVNLPFFNITAIYPWADSETIEQQVIQKIEDKLPSVKNISTFKSVSSNNVWVINLEFKRWTDKWTAYTDLQSAVDEVKSTLPSWVTNVTIVKTDTKDTPIYSFSVTWPYYPSVLYDKVSGIDDDLKKISWVDKVVINWKYTYQVEVEFDYEKLKQYNLRLPALTTIVSQSISQTPIDKKKLDWNLYSFEVRTYDKNWETEQENLANFKIFLENVALINQNWNILRLKDLAQVNVTHPFYQRLSYVNGNNAVTFMVYKVPWADILKVIDDVKNYLKSKEADFASKSITHQEMFSQEIMINQTYNSFIDWFIDTSILIMIIATLFLWLRWSIAIAITFPFVYLLTFISLKYFWYTFNSIVSVALNLSLWIMVDNLIVMTQWLQDWLRRWLWKFDAIKYALSIYWKPLLIWNLVTISMFFPLWFVLSGKIWEFLKFLPVTVNLTLAFSILVAFVFLPLVLSYMNFKVKENEHEENKLEMFFKKFEGGFIRIYKFILRFPKFFIISFYSFFAIVILSFMKFGSIDFMPLTDKDNIYVNLVYNKDIGIEKNQELTSQIHWYIKEFFENKHKWIVKNIELSLWELQSTSALDNTLYRTSFNPDLTKINIVLIGTEERENDDNALFIFPELKKYLDEKINNSSELKNKIKDFSVFIQKSWPSEWKDVTFNLSASWVVLSEIKLLSEEYEKFLPELKKIPWTYWWSSSLEYTNWKTKIIYDLDKLSQLNITAWELNMFLYWINQKSQDANYLTDYKWSGIQITNISDFGKDIIPVKWYISYTNNWWKTINFKDLMIPGTNIYVANVIKEIKIDPQIKSMQHLEWELVVKVDANKDPSVALSQITSKINEVVSKSQKVKMAYWADVKDMNQSWIDMWIAFLVWFILMFAILVLNFTNFAQPLVMMATMPLFITWALFFLLLSWETMSMLVAIWLFGLIWVWLAHIIYLLNRFNELLENSEWIKDLEWIILESVKSRLEPIFLTTTITAIWLFVLAASDEMWRAFALAFAGWLILWTTITLVFIPSALKLIYKDKDLNIENAEISE